ncbi:MAG: Peptidyl-prolyl cis-trans isomerase PpiD [Pseudolabrys sp.]|jgi:peptidyl-prolyl cis-trans isomerase D|nr:Peptidyl-prolyl cis-trans isomerase PpiD [Pseudolabrys sp.]
MLRGIHKASSGTIGKGIMAVVMGLLVISFAIWGIGDIFRGFGQSTFASVGSTEISAEQFRYYYTDKINQLGRRMGRAITPDQARSNGLDRQILGQLIAETALDQKAKEMRLGVSDAEISKQIMADRSFAGINGKFDRARFEQTIRDAGFSETRFVADQRALTVRRQLALSLTGNITAPVAAQDAINRFRNEKRSADVVVLGAAQAGAIAPPTPEALQKYFDERKAAFRAPEYRTVTLLALTPESQAAWMTVSDKDAEAYYNAHKAEYGTPEKRHLRQIVFPNEQDAQAAADKIAKGATFDDIVKERSLKESDVDLGTVTEKDVIDPNVAKAAFALKDGEVSKPVKGQFGTVLVQATNIQPGQDQTFQQVAPKIKQAIALERARGQIGDLRDKIEDERAGGATLQETAKKLKIEARTIDAIDRSGRDKAGNLVPNLPQGANVVNAIFSTDVDVDNEAIDLKNGGWLWYEVTNITPARDRTLDEVRAQVEKRWHDDEVASRLKKKAEDMVGKLKAGGKLAAVAQAEGLTVQTVGDLQRGKPKAPVAAPALDAIFRTAKDGAGSAEGDTEDTRLVFVVTGVTDPALDAKSAEAEQIAQVLKNGYGEDILNEYVTHLESQLGVSVNQATLQQIVGGGSGG